MLLCPLQNSAVKLLNWIQKRPVITQLFGENPDIYAQFGMVGHNGIDFACEVGTKLFAPADGSLRFLENSGYGKYCKIRSPLGEREIVLGHLHNFAGTNRDVKMGELIGYSGNTGFSTGPHLHFGMRNLLASNSDIWSWSVERYNNGYYGYIDILPWIVTWKGSLTQNTL
jgi:murein DD-endopeptidase MepM/ murein hydrolase activator NlpD